MSDLAKRLRIKAGMIEMGERIEWGSDSALMREAADALEMAAPAEQGEKPRRYPIGPLTYEKVFEAAGLTNLSDMQAVLDAVEAALSAPAAPAVHGDPVAMSNDKMRAEFDSWIEKQGMVTMKDGETYYHHATHAAWQAWKASRAALEIEMPPKLTQGDDYADGWNHALVLSSGEIGIAGVRVKS